MPPNTTSARFVTIEGRRSAQVTGSSSMIDLQRGRKILAVLDVESGGLVVLVPISDRREIENDRATQETIVDDVVKLVGLGVLRGRQRKKHGNGRC